MSTEHAVTTSDRLQRATLAVLQLRSLQWVSLGTTLYLLWHAEVYVGRWIGLGDSSWALPVAIDSYVVLALAVGRQVAPALLTLCASAGGGHFLIGWQNAANGASPAELWTRALAATAVGIGLVLVLWQCERLAAAGKVERDAVAAAELRHAAVVGQLEAAHRLALECEQEVYVNAVTGLQGQVESLQGQVNAERDRADAERPDAPARREGRSCRPRRAWRAGDP
jgi:hypothetical protein